MEIKRETTLREALDLVSMFLQQVREGEVSVGGATVGLDDRVRLDLEIESGKDEFELEFEIKWKAAARAASAPDIDEISTLRAEDAGENPLDVAPPEEPGESGLTQREALPQTEEAEAAEGIRESIAMAAGEGQALGESGSEAASEEQGGARGGQAAG